MINCPIKDLEYGDLVRTVWNDEIVTGVISKIVKRYLDNKARPFEWIICIGDTDVVFGPNDTVDVYHMVDTANKARTRNYTYGFLTREGRGPKTD